MGLADRATWRIDRLSGGQQQRVALAAALATRPGALILDEPTAHLDPRSATQLYAAIDRAPVDTLVVIEHDLDRVVDHVARSLLLDRAGELVGDLPLTAALGHRASAEAWAAQGVRLPAAPALARALSSDVNLPLTIDEGASWLAERPLAQQALCAAVHAPRPTTSGDVVIEARDLAQRYVGPATSFLALQKVDLRVREGELVAIVGANGSGKSTLLRVLTGLLRPEQGDVSVAGVRLRSASARQVAQLVAHVFQNPEAGFVADTVADEIAYGPRALGWSAEDIARHSEALLGRFGLTSLARANPFTLSGGQKRRLSVATSLVLGPRALLLDEPTFGQDLVSAHALMDEIASLCAHGLAVVIATHDLGLVADIADRVVALGDGQVVFDGPPLELLRDRSLLAQVGQEQPPLMQSARRRSGTRRAGPRSPYLARHRSRPRTRAPSREPVQLLRGRLVAAPAQPDRQARRPPAAVAADDRRVRSDHAARVPRAGAA